MTEEMLVEGMETGRIVYWLLMPFLAILLVVICITLGVCWLIAKVTGE